MSTLAERIQWILDNRGVGQGELSLAAGLSRQHVNTLLKRLKAKPHADVEGTTLAGLAKAGGVSLGWLATGQGHPEPADAESPPAPVAAGVPLPTDPKVTATIVVDEHQEEILEAAFKRGDFTLLASVVARHMLRNQGFLVKPGADVVHMVAKWMEAATRLQRRGELVTPDAIMFELAAKIVELERPAIDEQNAALRKRLKDEHGIEPELSPLMAEARRRVFIEETETAERLAREAEQAAAPGSKAIGAEGQTPKPGSAVRKKGGQ